MCACISVGCVHVKADASSCESPRECWHLNPGSLQEQDVLLTAEPFLSPALKKKKKKKKSILLITE